MHRGLIAIKVEIPKGTEVAFAKLVDAWVEGMGARSSNEPAAHEGDSEELLKRAVAWWRTLSATERAIFGTWVDVAPGLIAADVLAQRVGLKGPSSIRGHIRRFAQKASAVGFQAGWQSSTKDPLTGQVLYGLRDFGTASHPNDMFALDASSYAALLRQARATADSLENQTAPAQRNEGVRND